MGYGAGWDAGTYASSSVHSAFVYAASAAARAAAHPTLDPKGLQFRESRDSALHPRSKPIAVWLDTTGSNISQARIVHAAMPTMMGLLQRKGYVEDPQIMFSALGDATCDRVPLEVGQFEVDNAADENLGNFALEGGGGGQMSESYELALYVMARHTATDAWEKRGEKGYLFIVGDEKAYSRVKSREVAKLIGDGLESDIALAQIVAEVKQRWEMYFILPAQSSYGNSPEIPAFWKPLVGQNFLTIEDAEQIVPRIVAEIGACEGTDTDTILTDLAASGVPSSTLSMVKASLAGRPNSGGLATVTSGALVTSSTSETVRL